MSYKYSVLVDSPAAYWDLNSTTTGTATKKYNGGSMASGSYTNTPMLVDYVKSASSSFFTASYASPPLVSNASSAMYITDSNQYVALNSTDTFYKGYEDTTISMEFWFSFDKSFDGSGYSVNSSSVTRYFVNNKLTIMRIVNGSNEVGSIYYDYSLNRFVFFINPYGYENSESAYFVPTNLDGTFHITAIYDKGAISLIVNGINGVAGTVSTVNLFSNYSKSNGTYFVFEPSTLKTATGFMINNFSIYPYGLSVERIKRHMVMAFYTTDTEKYLQKYNISSIVGQDTQSDFGYSTLYSGTRFSDSGKIKNLLVTDSGLRNRSIDNLIPYTTYGGNATANSGSISFTASGGAIFPSFYNIIEPETYTITSQFQCSTTANVHAFSIPYVNGSDYIYCTLSTASGATLNYYNSSTNSSSAITQISTSLSLNTWYNLAFSTDGYNYYFILNSTSASGTIASFFVSSPNNKFELSNSSKILLGNFENNILSASPIKLRNIGVFDYAVSNFTGFDFTENKMLMAKVNGNLYVSQTGYWQSVIPVTLIQPGTIAGSKLSWETMDNCMVEISNDNGSTWTKAEKENYIPYIYPLQSTGNISDLFIRVTIATDYEMTGQSQHFNNLGVSLYNNLQIFSNDNRYLVNPASDSSGQHSYMKKSRYSKILTRPKNLGIHFETNSTAAGFAEIVTGAASPYAIDFWWSQASYNDTDKGYVIDSASSYASGPELHVKQTTHEFSVNHATLYVNGASVANNTFVPKLNDYYHLALIFDARYSASTLYLNGFTASAGAGHAHATYGDVCIWNELPTASDILKKYKTSISNDISVIADTAASSTYIFPDLTKVSVKAYKIGSQ